MTSKKSGTIRKFTVVAIALAAFALGGYLLTKHGTAVVSNPKTKGKTADLSAIFSDYQASPANSPQRYVLRLSPGTVLASLNGQALTAGDMLPPGSFNRDISSETCEYYRARAIDRELISQAAKAQGVDLNEAQHQQLARFQRSRQQSGPGLVRDLNGGPEELAFELRDAEAFMLQTSLMEKLGTSPDVTSQQVSDYYRQHASEFGDLPAGEPARQEAWGQIDVKIRQTLASSVRSDFQSKLADYMKRINTEARIQLIPLASTTEALE